MLLRIDRSVQTRRGRGMDLPEKRGSTYKGGCADDRGVHSEETGYNHEIRGDEEYIWEVQKLPKDIFIHKQNCNF